MFMNPEHRAVYQAFRPLVQLYRVKGKFDSFLSPLSSELGWFLHALGFVMVLYARMDY